MPGENLTPKQQAMAEMWEAHIAAEFKQKDIDATMATMSSDPLPSNKLIERVHQ